MLRSTSSKGRTFVAIILVTLLFLEPWTLQVAVALTEETQTPNSVEVGLQQTEETQTPLKKQLPIQKHRREDASNIVKELIEKRTEYSQEFLLSNGLRKAVIRQLPMHYKDKEGNWQDVDETITPSADPLFFFENKRNSFETYFARNANADDVVRIRKDDFEIGFKPLLDGADTGMNTIFPLTGMSIYLSLASTDTAFSHAKVNRNRINYGRAFKKASLNYYVLPGKVKEEIILDDSSTANTYSFSISAKGLTPKQMGDGRILFFDENDKPQFVIPKPWMKDSSKEEGGAISLDVKQSISKQGNHYILEVVADRRWLDDPNRVYPVVIDPVIGNYDSYIVQDTFVGNLYPYDVYSDLDRLAAGYTSTKGVVRSLIQFSKPFLDDYPEIFYADVGLYQYDVTDPYTIAMDVYRVTSYWNNSTYWNSQPAFDANRDSEELIYAQDEGWYYVDVTNSITKWYDKQASNYGILLKSQNEAQGSGYKLFRSSNYYDSYYHPELTIFYYPLKRLGTEPYWDYASNNLDGKHAAQTNTSNGNLVLKRADTLIPGRGIPIDVQRTYNSRSTFQGPFGYGWHANFMQQVVTNSDGDIYYLDEDRSLHKFENNYDGTYQPAPGKSLSLTKNYDGSYTIKDSQAGITLNFNTSGKLVNISDEKGNTNTYYYNGSGQLTTIYDASSRPLTIQYNGSGLIEDIYDQAGGRVHYTYSNGNLYTVTTAYGTTGARTTIYTYDDPWHNLRSIQNARGYTSYLNYDAADRTSTLIDTNNKTDQYSYDGLGFKTERTDPRGYKTFWEYNNDGNPVKKIEGYGGVNSTTTYTWSNYDLIGMVDPRGNASGVPSNYTHTYAYDSTNPNYHNLTREDHPLDSSDASYEYENKSGKTSAMISETDALGEKTTFTNDAEANPTQITEPVASDPEASGKDIKVASSSKYDSYGNVASEIKPSASTFNKVKNSSFEKDSNSDGMPDQMSPLSSVGSYKGGTSDFVGIDTTQGFFGKKSLKIYRPQNTPDDKAIFYAGKFSVTSSGMYSLSYQLKTSSVGRASAYILYYDSNNNYLNTSSFIGWVSGTNDWARIAKTIKVPSNAAYGDLQLHVYGTGTAWFDALQLEKGSSSSSYNQLENANIQYGSENWGFGSGVSLDSNTFDSGSQSAKVYLANSSDSGISQGYIPVNPSKPFTLSGFVKTQGVSGSGAQILVYFYDSNYQYITYCSTTLQTGTSTGADDSWMRHTCSGTVPSNASYAYVNAWLWGSGTAWFDCIRLDQAKLTSTSTYDANGNYITQNTDSLGRVTSYQYDSAGNNTKITDPKGNSTNFNYSSQNELTGVNYTIGGVAQSTSYGYDIGGNLERVTDGRSKSTYYGYNAADLLASITDPLGYVTSFSYDNNKNLSSVSYPNGKSLSNSYDALNRLTQASYSFGPTFNFGYDVDGNLTEIKKDGVAKHTYTYDNAGRTSSFNNSERNYYVNYGYDANNNVTSKVFDSSMPNSDFSWSYAYDKRDKPISVTDLFGTTYFTYDEEGALTNTSHKNNTEAHITYDSEKQIASVINDGGANGSNPTISSHNLSYDANGNITNESLKIGDISGTNTYTYDELNRIKTWYSDVPSNNTQPPTQDTQPPTQPTNLKATSVSSTQINLSWSASADNVGVTAYDVERSTDGLVFTQIASALTNSYSDTGLDSNTTYRYKVRARDANNNLSAYSAIASATPNTARYEDDNTNIIYSGTGWTDETNSSHSQGKAKYTSTVGDSLTFTFNGTSISWISHIAYNRGKAKVYLDGVLDQTVNLNLYAAGAWSQRQIYSKTGLSNTSHTIKIELIADDYGSGCMMIDAFDVVAGGGDTTPPPAPTGLSAISGAGKVDLSWSAVAASDLAGYNIYRSTISGSVYTKINSSHVTSTTYTDNTVVANTTYYYVVKAVDVSNNESPGSNEVSATPTDGSTPTTRYEEQNPFISYYGTWYLYGTTNASGSYFSFKSAITNGAYAEFTFIGTSVTWIGNKSSSNGIAEVYLDGVMVTEVDCYNSTTLYQQTLYSTSGLANTYHTLKIVRSGRKNTSSSDYRIDIDCIDVQGYASLPEYTTRYEETDPSIIYTGNWTNDTSPSYSNGTTKWSEDYTTPAKATFTFTGTVITWIGSKTSGTAYANVYIDNGPPTSVNLWSGSGYVDQQHLFTKSDLSPGTHTIVVEVDQLPAGHPISVDAFDVVNPPTSQSQSTYSAASTDPITRSYSYDAAGNITSDGSKTYTYNNANQLTSDGTYSYTYDQAGNLTGDGINTYTWNYANLLSKVTLPGSYISFDYDGKGRRTYKYNSQTGEYTYFEYDENFNLVAETKADKTVIATYTYDGSGRPISMYQPASGATYYFHYNAHGDVVALTDTSAKVVATYNYDPWGKPTSEWYDGGVTIRNPFRYGGAFGYYYDSETGMYYLRARYYKPDIYRFISKDPVQGDLRDPMSLNLYAYCGSNPVNAVDPDGLCVTYGAGSHYRQVNVRWWAGKASDWHLSPYGYGKSTGCSGWHYVRWIPVWKIYDLERLVYKNGKLIHRIVVKRDVFQHMGRRKQDKVVLKCGYEKYGYGKTYTVIQPITPAPWDF